MSPVCSGGIGERKGKPFYIYVTMDLYEMARHTASIVPFLNNRCWVKDHVAHQMRRHQCIQKPHSSFNDKVWGWILLKQGLAFMSMLHQVGMENSTCVLCSNNETIVHVFLRYPVTKVFWTWFQAEFHFFKVLLSWKGPLPAENLDGSRQLQTHIAFCTIDCYWLYVEALL